MKIKSVLNLSIEEKSDVRLLNLKSEEWSMKLLISNIGSTKENGRVDMGSNPHIYSTIKRG